MTATKNSTRQMHVYRGTPHCFVIGGEAQARALPADGEPRARWAFDGGEACGDHMDAAWSAIALEHTPGCASCCRKLRAELIRDGKLEPHQRVITNPQKRAA
ncbi:hypothetical protein [Azospirillum sp. TSO5]|uniref:hypothetical protein n=1 Tax=Azospirillum sp. TSO5 TaxID=716760 RepID=UPI000D60EAD4|nr:hypothetical protein [Azospirillum sp. TSO5]PWC96939.1 hypothetical protein TSO5_05775 [Azospirillum sp. TSO5]